MKVIYSTIVLIICISCSPKVTSTIYISHTDTYGSLKNGIPQYDTLIVNLDKKDTISYGKYALTTDKKISSLKTGIWKTFHSNGNIRHEGNYKVGSYINCCTAGYCKQYYHFRVGKWNYYNEKGELVYELDFKPDTLHINTSCEGGDNVVFGLIKDFSKLDYKYGLTPDEIFQLQKVEIEDYKGYGKTIVIPISGELIFRIEK